MAAYNIKVKAPGRKKAALYGGEGRIVINRIHAVIYEQPLPEIQAWCDELAKDNPGYEFSPRLVPGW